MTAITTCGLPSRPKLERSSLRLARSLQLLLLAGGVFLHLQWPIFTVSHSQRRSRLVVVVANAWSPPDVLLSRRAWLWSSSTAAVVCVPTTTMAAPPEGAVWVTQAGRHGCTTVSDPAKTVVTCTGDVLALSSPESAPLLPPRLSSIAATENGVSTSAIRNPAAYMTPWSYLPETSNANTAWESLIAALQQQQQQQQSLPLQLVTDLRTDKYFYLHATVPTQQQPPGGTGGLDDVEFVLRPEEQLVLFRSASRTSIFVYPLLQPVSDRQSHRKRLESIRQRLGWSELA